VRSGMSFRACSTFLPIGAAVVVVALSAFAQQGWSQLQIVKQGDQGAAVNSVYYDGNEVWIVGGRGLIGRSYDEGISFQQTDLGLDAGLNDIFVRKDRIWIVGDAGSIIQSTDRGRSFVKRVYTSRTKSAKNPTSPGAIDLYSVQFIEKDRGFIVGDDGLILASTDGGVSWSEQKSGTDAQLFHLAFREEHGWAVGTGGTIIHTDDGGRNWYKQYSGTNTDLNRVWVVSDRILIVTGDGGTLLRTGNAGATWEQVPLKVSEPLFGVSFVDTRTGWVVGYKGRIIRTYDGGRNWVEQMSATSTDLFAVSFHKNRGYAVGRDGLIMTYYEKR
jgi:photosystem II stability/assembly factor-like uncharacterized protein